MAKTSKYVELTFQTEGNGTLTVSVANPKDGLTKAEAEAAAEKIRVVLQSPSGALAVALKSARIVTSEVSDLV